MEFKRRWLGYDRQQIQNTLSQTTDANNAARAHARQLLNLLESENEQLEDQYQYLQERLAQSITRAERLRESSYIVDTAFAIMDEALASQRREILQIAGEMAHELNQRCRQLQAEANDMDAAIAVMQKQIDEKEQLYYGILASNGEEIARINEKFQQLVQAQNAIQGEMTDPQAPMVGMPPAADQELVVEKEERPSLQLVASSQLQAAIAELTAISPEPVPAGPLEKPADEPIQEENPLITSSGSDSVSA